MFYKKKIKKTNKTKSTITKKRKKKQNKTNKKQVCHLSSLLFIGIILLTHWPHNQCWVNTYCHLSADYKQTLKTTFQSGFFISFLISKTIHCPPPFLLLLLLLFTPGSFFKDNCYSIQINSVGLAALLLNGASRPAARAGCRVAWSCHRSRSFLLHNQ